jgi:putative acetyltransferase
LVRPATLGDHAAIRRVVAAAFGEPGPGQTGPEPATIIEGVRAEGAALIELVEELDGEIAGHVLFSRMKTTPARFVAGLGPLAVRPDLQNRGIGQVLSRAGIEAVRSLGAEAVMVLGHPPYYPRFGFSHALAAPLVSPFADREAFMGLELTPGALRPPLKVDYPAAFG